MKTQITASDYMTANAGSVDRFKFTSSNERARRIANLYQSGKQSVISASMAGPITIRVTYEGVARNVLVEDFVPAGMIKQYPVLDQLPSAFVLNSNDGEVQINRIEAKRVIPTFGRIATEFEVSRTDMQLSNADVIAYAEDQSVQAIAKTEDSLLFKGLDLGIAAETELSGTTDNNVEISGSTLSLDSLLSAQGFIEGQQLTPGNVIINPADMYDFYRWDITVVGVSFKEDFVAGYKRNSFGNLGIVSSIQVPKNTVYVAPPAQQVGVFATSYGIESNEDPSGVSKFVYRTVLNELVSILVLNHRGLVKLHKTA